ncbi:uncharacterized protein [Palaemon carinicauda]|uniref:uncharacterized protein n=1 Tax=Palaemon carinicauda TaxID=392227 RepID=UPI0035B65C2A
MDSSKTVEKNVAKDAAKMSIKGGGAVEKTKKAINKDRKGLSLSLRRSKLWTSLHNKTLELPERLRREERKLSRVPRLQIWLSTDQSNRDPVVPEEQPVLNNHREQLPKLHLENPRAIYRSASEGAKWKIVIDGSSPPTLRDGPGGAALQDCPNERPKSPVEKQPTWPMSHNHNQFLHPRPKLMHQDNIQQQQLQQQQKQKNQTSVEGERRRGELPRQDAVAEEVDLKEFDCLKPEEPSRERQDSICSVDLSLPNTPGPPLTPNTPNPNPANRPSNRPRLIKTPNSLGVGNFWPRRVSASSRSCSDDKSELSEFSARSDSTQSDQAPPEMVTLSVNSMYSFAESGSLNSPGSSHLSLRSEVSNAPSLFAHPFVIRSNSTSATTTAYEKSQNRLLIPGQDSQRSRRPSLLSLRSLARSLNPYVSVDYDYDSFDYDPGNMSGSGGAYHLGPYLPEPVPKLSFTQKLAFPTLVQNSIDRPKPRDPYMEAEHNMNTFAKIITIVVLALVTVLVLGVLYKLLH